MRGITFPGDREVAVLNFPEPTPGPGEVVVEIKASGMCGTDLHVYRAPRDPTAFRIATKGMPFEVMRDEGPIIVGHEPCGVVVAVGAGVPERQAKVGQRALIHHYSACGGCDQCRTGWTQICESVRPTIYGSNAHGGHAEYMKLPAHTILTLPEPLSFEAGAALACGSGTAFAALRRMNVSGAHTVAIFGQGPVGLSGTQFAVAMGCRVIALDINTDRLERAKSFGADVVLNPTGLDVRQAIRDLTHGLGADFAMETSGAQSAQAEAVRCLRYWGTVGFVGIGASTTLNLGVDVVLRQINMFGSFTFSSPLLRECAQFAVDHKIALEAIFTDRWKFDQAAEAYTLFDAQTTGKGVFIM